MEPKEKFYITVAYPYPSGAMHVGHGRTYTVPDVIARFKRMQGYDTLYPMAFHCTGTPVVGVAERIKEEDPQALWLYGKIYKVPEKILETFTKPENIVGYFSREYREVMERLNLHLDWGRTFHTTDQHYQKFIQWQYRKLMALGFLKKGKHPVKWCPKDRNPVGDHDLLQGEEAEISLYTLLKFRLDGAVLPPATLRPETIFGVTNLWVNPDVKYVRARVEDETWIVSREALTKLSAQLKKVEEIQEISGKDLVGKEVTSPLTKKRIPILPASLVDEKVGTGVVFSVPAHAPYDYAALVDLKKEDYSLAKKIEPVSIIEVEGYGKFPASELYERMKISHQMDPKLEKATEILYKDEFTKGRLIQEIKRYGGLPVSIARDRVRDDMRETGDADILYDFSQHPVVCRCNTRCLVRLLEDQWFLSYSNPSWKKNAHSCLAEIKLFPKEIRSQFEHTIEWLEEWACTRKVGLGTPFPWDSSQIIEPLSDSVIYMAYYTIAPYIKEILPEKVTDELFDYIFLGGEIPKEIDSILLERMRKDFLYWYPYDWRFSAKDLVGNHLTFQIFHHTAIFERSRWPKGIVVFGMALTEGEKMSSSKGNVVLLSDALDSHGSDAVRFFLVSVAEPWQDFDWREKSVEAVKESLSRFKRFAELILGMKAGRKEERDIDKWLLSRFQRRVEKTVLALENFQTRQAVQEGFYGVESDIRWYRKRTDIEKAGSRWTLKIILHNWIRLLYPFIPKLCSSLWEKTEKGDIITTGFPSPNEVYIDESAELSEELIEKTYQDINEILKVTKLKPSRIILYTAPRWKIKLMRLAREEKDVMKKAREEKSLLPHLPEIQKTVKLMFAHIHSIGKEKAEKILELNLRESDVLKGASDFFRKEFGCKVDVYDAERARYDPLSKAKNALPFKPAIYVEAT